MKTLPTELGPYEVVVRDVPHQTVFVRQCSCGFTMSAVTLRAVVSNVIDHLAACHNALRYLGELRAE